MACVNPDGTLSGSAQSILDALREPAAAEAIAASTGLPLFRIRSGLREMQAALLIEEREGVFFLTDSGRARTR